MLPDLACARSTFWHVIDFSPGQSVGQETSLRSTVPGRSAAECFRTRCPPLCLPLRTRHGPPFQLQHDKKLSCVLFPRPFFLGGRGDLSLPAHLKTTGRKGRKNDIENPHIESVPCWYTFGRVENGLHRHSGAQRQPEWRAAASCRCAPFGCVCRECDLGRAASEG